MPAKLTIPDELFSTVGATNLVPSCLHRLRLSLYVERDTLRPYVPISCTARRERALRRWVPRVCVSGEEGGVIMEF